jgi:hypothetical protein
MRARMKPAVTALLVVAPLLTLIGLIAWFVLQNRPASQPECDEVWVTRMSLLAMEDDICRYIQISTLTDRDALRRAHSLNDIWETLGAKPDVTGRVIQLPVNERYVFDGWNQPYAFDNRANGKVTTIRITSQGPQGENFLEMSFGEDRVTIRHSWEGQRRQVGP